jgi:hypothetical protein
MWYSRWLIGKASDREAVSSSTARTGRVKPKTLKYVVIARHLEVRITGLSDITLKMQVPCLSRCGM